MSLDSGFPLYVLDCMTGTSAAHYQRANGIMFFKNARPQYHAACNRVLTLKLIELKAMYSIYFSLNTVSFECGLVENAVTQR